MANRQTKQLGPVGQRMTHAIWTLDQLANVAQCHALQGRCCPDLANMLSDAAAENHAAALEVCRSQGYEPMPTPQFGQK